MGFWETLGGIIALIIAIFMIVDIWTKQKKMEQTHKILWTIGAVLPAINIIVAIAYYFVVYKK